MSNDKIDIEHHLGRLRKARDEAIAANLGNKAMLLNINAASAVTMTALEVLYHELNAYPDSDGIAHDTIVALAKGMGGAIVNTLMAIHPSERAEALAEIKQLFGSGADFALAEQTKVLGKLERGELQFDPDGAFTIAVSGRG